MAVALLAVSPWGNGWDSFKIGAIAALTGTPAYFIFRKIYGGRRALEAKGLEDGAVGAVADPSAED